MISTTAIVTFCLISCGLILALPQLDNRLLLIFVVGFCGLTIHYKHKFDSAAITSSRQAEDHQILIESIQQSSMPFAVYDSKDRLLAWNTTYESLYRRSFDQLNTRSEHSPVYYQDLVRSNASVTMTGEALEKYIAERVRVQRNPSGSTQDRKYPDFGWYRVSKYVTPSGGVAGFAIDINELKQREAELTLEVEQRRQLEVTIRALANTDSLTGISNRRHFMEKAEEAFQRSRNAENPLILLMIDIDHFKQINDQHGHATGDQVIKEVANKGAEIISDGRDSIGRLGGEEFAIMLTNQSINEAWTRAECVRTSVSNDSEIAPENDIHVTISIGLARQHSTDTTLGELLARADAALYQAKREGRDRTAISSQNHAV